jgi:hypothetical protein
MNATGDLIDRLAARTPRASGDKRLAFALPLAAAALASIAAMAALLGAPFASGLHPALAKWAFSLPLTAGAIASLYALAHPGRRSSLLLTLTLAPFAAVAVLAMLESTGGLGDFPGADWQRGPVAILVLGGLGFAAAIYVTRLFAPVRLHRTGAAAGLVGGGIAASAYAPFCQHSGAVYLLVFFAVPIAALAALGWLAGPRLLRW